MWKVPLILLLSQWLANGNNNTTHTKRQLFAIFVSFVWLESVFGNVPLSIGRLPAIVPSSHTFRAQGKTDWSAGRAWLFDLCSDFLFFFYFFFCVIFHIFYFTFCGKPQFIFIVFGIVNRFVLWPRGRSRHCRRLTTRTKLFFIYFLTFVCACIKHKDPNICMYKKQSQLCYMC